MANSNFVVHNGITVGPLTIDAATGDMTTTGTISVTGGGSFGGLDSAKIQSGGSNVQVTGSYVNVSVNGSNVASFGASGLTTSAGTFTAITASGYVNLAGNVSAAVVNAGALNATGTTTLAATNISGYVNLAGNVSAAVVNAGALNATGTTTLAATNISGYVNLAGNISSPQVNAGAITTTGHIVVGGNLTVNGTTTTVNSTTVDIADLNITVAKGAADSAAANGAGLTVDGASATILYTHTGTKWVLNKATDVLSLLIGGTAVTSTATELNKLDGYTGSVTELNYLDTLHATGVTDTEFDYLDGVSSNIQTQLNDKAPLASPTFTTAITTPVITKSGSNGVGDIGQTANRFATIYGLATSAQYADLAEKYVADADIEPGTVVHFGGEHEVSTCDVDHCQAVAGVVSTDPAYRMNDALEAEHVAMVALTGRVPCKVTGTVAKGDMMVSAGNGRARAEANPKVGAVIGKALEASEGEAVIEVVVGKH